MLPPDSQRLAVTEALADLSVTQPLLPSPPLAEDNSHCRYRCRCRSLAGSCTSTCFVVGSCVEQLVSTTAAASHTRLVDNNNNNNCSCSASIADSHQALSASRAAALSTELNEYSLTADADAAAADIFAADIGTLSQPQSSQPGRQPDVGSCSVPVVGESVQSASVDHEALPSHALSPALLQQAEQPAPLLLRNDEMYGDDEGEISDMSIDIDDDELDSSGTGGLIEYVAGDVSETGSQPTAADKEAVTSHTSQTAVLTLPPAAAQKTPGPNALHCEHLQ